MNAKLAAVFKRLFDVSELRHDLTPKNVKGWDSFSQIELVMELEKVFGVSIPASDGIKLNSVGKIVEYLRARGVSED